MDDLKHFFFECDDVSPLWETILNFVCEKYYLSDQVREFQSVILGCPNVPPIINLIILIVKQHIVSCKLASEYQEPKLEILRKGIQNFAQAELIIAKKTKQRRSAS